MSVSDQKKGDAIRKQLPYVLFGASAVCGFVGLVSGTVSRIVGCFIDASITVSGAVTVGAIGGADGPTAVFVTAAPWKRYIIPAAALVIGIVGILVLRKRRRK